MHASRLAELASWVAVNSGNLIYGDQDQPMLVATSYWTASKKRLQHWVTALKMFERDFEDPTPGHRPWNALDIVIQEIFVSEMLTRIWSATVLMHDWYHQADELHGLAHSVHLSHVEVKNRALRTMLKGQADDEATFDQLNGLRRRMERWTDVFLGQLPFGEKSAQFGFDKKRVADFHREQRESVGPEFEMRQRVLVSSFAEDISKGLRPYAANPDLNRDVAAGILACFPADRFDSIGMPESVKLIWIEKAHSETQMLVDHLADFETKIEQASV
ncbi:MAG: hypothetical protein AAFN77_09630 [Planctomycetota bacterium]